MENTSFVSSIRRVRFFYVLLVVVTVVFGLRLFYLQILQHNYYESQALNNQLKQYEIPAERGVIYAYDGNEIVPLVLNETRYRIVADPQLVRNPAEQAVQLSSVLNMSAVEIENKLKADCLLFLPASE